jgi:two-component system, OmpR family, alkaline phosphatase synthesis response regulator PhoP
MTRILIAEDDADLARGLRNNLEIEGYEVDTAADGEAAVSRATSWRPALMILDLMLPKIDGLRVLRSVRQHDTNMLILILTARGDESDKVRGLKLGADDYLTKPFGLLELLARVETLLRRHIPTAQEIPMRFGDIEVHVARREVLRGGAVVPLRPKEFELLLALIEARGKVLTRVNLMRNVWGYPSAVITRTVDTHMAELRRKLEADPSEPRHFITVPKIGYRFDS